MKLTSAYTLFAESVIRDQSQKASFINIFDRVFAKELPAVQQKLTVIFGLHVDKDKHLNRALHFYAYDPSGKTIVSSEIGSIDTGDSAMAQVIGDLSGMPLTEYGNYTFKLGYSEDEIIASRVLEVLPATKEKNQ